MTEFIQWFATGATVAAAIITAANLGARITGIGFCVFLAGSLAWLATGLLTGQAALSATNAVLTLINIFGIWRWLGRQAKVEEGGRTAARASERSAGEGLVPVSLLTRAPIEVNGREVGRCVDAMLGARSGRLHYVVMSDGGVAGVGEELRRIDWDLVEADPERIRAELPGGVEDLPRIERDRWPAR